MAAYIPQHSFKRATEAEMALVWQWRNAPQVRRNMFDHQPISWSAHQQWYQQMLQSGIPDYWLFWQNERPIGVLNFNYLSPEGTASCIAQWGCYLGEEQVWPGSGMLLEVAALDYALAQKQITVLQAEVLAFNQNVINMHRWFGYEVEQVVAEFVERDGEYVDKWVMNKSLVEWAEQRDQVLDKLPPTYQQAIAALHFIDA